MCYSSCIEIPNILKDSQPLLWPSGQSVGLAVGRLRVRIRARTETTMLKWY